MPFVSSAFSVFITCLGSTFAARTRLSLQRAYPELEFANVLNVSTISMDFAEPFEFAPRYLASTVDAESALVEASLASHGAPAKNSFTPAPMQLDGNRTGLGVVQYWPGAVRARPVAVPVQTVYRTRPAQSPGDEKPYPGKVLSGRSGTYTFERKLGNGAFGEVWKATSNTNQAVAIKTMMEFSSQQMQDMNLEIGINKVLSANPYVTKMVDYVESDLTKQTPGVMVLEFAPYGTLEDSMAILEKDPNCLLKFLHDISTAFTTTTSPEGKYISWKLFIHADIKLENVLVFPDEKKQNVVFKLADFGLSTMFGEVDFAKYEKNAKGTPGYIAPEVWQGNPPKREADVFALGAAVVAIQSGFKNPASKACALVLGDRHCTSHRDYGMASQKMFELCRGEFCPMLTPDPIRRMTMDELRSLLEKKVPHGQTFTCPVHLFRSAEG